MRLHGRVAAITGAASGIGRALADEAARRGCELALSDIDEVGLGVAAEAASRFGTRVTTCRVDTADRTAVTAWADRVVSDHGRVNLIINNAGVGLSAPVASMSDADLDWLLGINLYGVLHGTRAFLPHLKAAGEGHVVNVSSVFGLVPIPTQSAYNTAKYGVRGFTDALRIELEAERCGVSATTVHPGGIRTNIARNARMDPATLAAEGGRDAVAARFDQVARTTPERAAAVILDAVEANRRRVLIGADARVLDLLSRLPLALTQRLLAAGYRRTTGSR